MMVSTATATAAQAATDHWIAPWIQPRTITQCDAQNSGHNSDKNSSEKNRDSGQQNDIAADHASTHHAHYRLLKQRLATLPTRSQHSRQVLYVDLWTGQHWLGLKLVSGCEGARFRTHELLKPISTDTALSLGLV